MTQTQIATRKPADQFGTSVVRPPDFDEFWAAIMAEVNAIPLNPTMEHVPLRSTDEVDVYEIGYDSLDGVRLRSTRNARQVVLMFRPDLSRPGAGPAEASR